MSGLGSGLGPGLGPGLEVEAEGGCEAMDLSFDHLITTEQLQTLAVCAGLDMQETDLAVASAWLLCVNGEKKKLMTKYFEESTYINFRSENAHISELILLHQIQQFHKSSPLNIYE